VNFQPETKAPPPEPKKSETDLQWEHIMESMDRPLALCDLDFTDLNSDDEENILAPHSQCHGIPPPPPPISLSQLGGAPPPPPSAFGGRPPAPPAAFRQLTDSDSSELAASQEKLAKKSKKTVKLFWKEVRDDAAIMARLQKTGLSLIWDELSPVSVDTQKLEHLFESRAKDIVPKV
jgi:FH1/FH2 domain-containing protein 3